jgi:polysaccharide pyruvyl transferase WcaK-like protein
MQYPNDLIIIKSIISKMKCKGYIIKNKYDMSQVMGITSKLDMLIGMRLHALISAVSQNIPVVGLVYQPKVEWLLDYIDQSHASAGDVKSLEIENLKEIIDNVWENRETIKEHFETVTSNLKNKSIENAQIAVSLLKSDNRD